MALYTRGVPVSVIDDGQETPLTAPMLAAEVLAQAGGIEAVKGPRGPQGVGLPAGGSAGQLLAKASSTDHDTGWVEAPPSGGTAATAALRRLGSATGEAAAGAAAAGHVAHGATETAARPTGYAVVVWVGSARPLNGVAGDIWIRTS